jgi:SCY1-like protein 1
VLKFIDGAESETKIYIGTEWAEPVSLHLKSSDENLTKYGLFKLASTLKMISDSALVHGNVCMDSVFVTKSGEWRLGGLDFISAMTEESPVLASFGNILGSYAVNIPPEVKKDGWTLVKTLPPHSTDAWAFGCLIYELFNGLPSRIEV